METQVKIEEHASNGKTEKETKEDELQCTVKISFMFSLGCSVLFYRLMQLNMEREAGRVFNGFKEGRILFARTFKYSHNSDSYAGETVKSKKKRRTPAWYFCLLALINVIYEQC